MITFNDLCENISGINMNGQRFGQSVDDISAWYFENDYNKFVGSECVENGFTIEYDGKKYVDHWFIVNEKHESSVVGHTMVPIDHGGDLLFYISGCHMDSVVSFDEMISCLKNETFFID